MAEETTLRSEVTPSRDRLIAGNRKRSTLQRFQWIVKGVVEWVAALALLLLTLPLQLLIALVIKLDSPGPVLFVQERLGRQGKIFKMLKFRTLRWKSDAAPILNRDGSTRVEADDPRLTQVGRRLRAGWDELPQLINVLKGEMALIGPRPDEHFHRQYYFDQELRKLSVRPGITGLPQVTGRNAIPWKERIGLDLTYIDNYSLGMDARIFCKTLLLFLKRKGVALDQ